MKRKLQVYLALLTILSLFSGCAKRERTGHTPQERLDNLIYEEKIAYYKNLPSPIHGTIYGNNKQFFEVTLHLGYIDGDSKTALLFKENLTLLAEAVRVFFGQHTFEQLILEGGNHTKEAIEAFNFNLKHNLLIHLQDTLSDIISNPKVKKKYDSNLKLSRAYFADESDKLPSGDYSGLADAVILQLNIYTLKD